MGHDANKPADNHGDKHDKGDNSEKNARKARGEAGEDLKAGSLNETTKAKRQEQFDSGNSGVTGKGDKNGKFRSAKDIIGDAAHTPLTKEAEAKRDAEFKSKHGDPNELQGAKADRLADRAANYHRDIAAQIKDGFKHRSEIESEGPKAAAPDVPLGEKIARNQLEHPESAPIQFPKVNVGEMVDTMVQNTARVLDNTLKVVKLSDAATFKDLDYQACKAAIERFPELQKYGVNEKVIAGIILNELVHRDTGDDAEDKKVRETGKVLDDEGSEKTTASIGPAQIQVRNVSRLAEEYPEMKEFRSDPARAAIEPSKAPYFVAAYLQEKVDRFKQHDQANPKEPTPKCFESLVYTYNPDVVSRADVQRNSLKADDYREITALEKLEAKVTGHRAGSLKDWTSENYPRNLAILQKSGVVKTIKQSMHEVESHFGAK